MISGFHGNTDPVMVMFLFIASVMLFREKPALCGLFLALSCQIKIIPLLLFPIFFFFWLSRGAGRFVPPPVCPEFGCIMVGGAFEISDVFH